jgi:branched-chain amino acid aminotransferase
MGITRDSVIQLAAALGYRVEIRKMRAADLQKSGEIFLTGTACEILPIAELDGQPVGHACPGPVTEEIRTAFDRAKTGLAREWEHWLYRVPAESGVEPKRRADNQR